MHLGLPWSQRSSLPDMGEPTTLTLATGPTPAPIQEMREPNCSVNHLAPSGPTAMPSGAELPAICARGGRVVLALAVRELHRRDRSWSLTDTDLDLRSHGIDGRTPRVWKS
jgi:hypothetical protein